MPRLTPDTTRAARTVTLWSLRLIGVWLISWGLFQIVSRLINALSFMLTGSTGSLLQNLSVIHDSAGEHGFFRGTSALLIGIALALASRHLARWIIRPPSHGCLRCDHPLAESDHPVPARCPECGEPTA
ncbi:MAG: hypothetical protein ACF8Q5_01290 [Phycisphaerales bacterium JB040]